METKTLEELKGSEKLKIQAAVLEILETKNFSLDRDLGIVESTEDSNQWIMAFTNKRCKLEELVSVKQILGEKFNVEITSKSKENFLFRIEAPCEEFMRISRSLRPLAAAQVGAAPSQTNKNF